MAIRDTEQAGVKRIADALLVYLDKHPQAADTLEGISQWWLPKQRACSRDDILRALEHLIAQGRIDKHVSPDGACMYRGRHAV